MTEDHSAWLSMEEERGKDLLVWNNKVEVNFQSFKGLEHMLPIAYNTVSDNRKGNLGKNSY